MLNCQYLPEFILFKHDWQTKLKDYWMQLEENTK